MDIYEEIQDKLRKEWQSGATQQEMADKYQTTNPHINRLINDLEKVKKIGLQTFLNMFPYAKIDLTGDTTNIQNSGNIASNIKGNNIQSIVNADCDKHISKLLDAIMSSDLDDTSKVKVYKIIKES